jgi:hypothetical protein
VFSFKTAWYNKAYLKGGNTMTKTNASGFNNLHQALDSVGQTLACISIILASRDTADLPTDAIRYFGLKDFTRDDLIILDDRLRKLRDNKLGFLLEAGADDVGFIPGDPIAAQVSRIDLNAGEIIKRFGNGTISIEQAQTEVLGPEAERVERAQLLRELDELVSLHAIEGVFAAAVAGQMSLAKLREIVAQGKAKQKAQRAADEAKDAQTEVKGKPVEDNSAQTEAFGGVVEAGAGAAAIVAAAAIAEEVVKTLTPAYVPIEPPPDSVNRPETNAAVANPEVDRDLLLRPAVESDTKSSGPVPTTKELIGYERLDYNKLKTMHGLTEQSLMEAFGQAAPKPTHTKKLRSEDDVLKLIFGSGN